ncbi:PrgI family protein [Thomasclavelia ramosa]|uniref:PrgI family protein n=1 Tax=Thomasclavelia ramosa TaxID=1547 RepID=UPI00189DF568|nr:PrgI family protein [Thomasclavelia ramosa]
MEIKLNKEIREYTESIFFGLTMRQCFFSVLACIGAVVVYFLTIDTLGMEITSWLCILVALPLAALGFVTYQGMNAEDILITAICSLILSRRKLYFIPTNIYYELLKPMIIQKQKEDSLSDDKKLRKIKKKRKTKIQSS